jgi:hypothetical protein
MISFPLVRYVLTAAFRDKILLTLLSMIIVSASLSVFLGSSSMTEQDSFALVFGASSLRFLSVIGVVLFIAFYMRRSFETKEVEFLLSRPLSRLVFLYSHAAAFIFLSLMVSVTVTVAVFMLGKPDVGGLMAWGLSIGVENMIVAATALFFSMVLSSAAGSALATLGFYALCRLIGTLLVIAARPPEKPFFFVLNNIMEVISVVVPRLDLMGQTSWLVYGVEGSGGIGMMEGAGTYAHRMAEVLGVEGFIGVQGLFCIFLLLAASSYDFIRRQF